MPELISETDKGISSELGSAQHEEQPEVCCKIGEAAEKEVRQASHCRRGSMGGDGH